MQIIPHFSALKKCPREIDRYQFCQRMQLRFERSQFCGYNQLDERVKQKNVVFRIFGEFDFYCTLIILYRGDEIVLPRKIIKRLKANDWKIVIINCPTKCPTVRLSVHRFVSNCPFHLSISLLAWFLSRSETYFNLSQLTYSFYHHPHLLLRTCITTFVCIVKFKTNKFHKAVKA